MLFIMPVINKVQMNERFLSTNFSSTFIQY